MKRILSIGALAIVISLVWAYWYTNQTAIQVEITETPKGNIFTGGKATTTLAVSDQKIYNGQAVGFLGGTESLAQYPKEFVDNYRARLENAVAMTKEFPDDEIYWIEIGLVKKTVNNYVGARDAWEYAKILNPENSVIYHNLGNLYALYLNDFVKAEKNYKLSMALDPLSAQPYLALADFYKDFYKAKSDLTDDILLEGLGFLPNDGNLILNLALYYKSVGNKEGAISYFSKFLALPDLTGQQEEAIKAEIESLKVS